MSAHQPPPDSPASTLLDEAPCALIRTTADGRFLKVNATFCAWLGYTPGELVGRRRVQDLLTMGGKIFHQTHWAPLLQMQGSISEVRLEMVHKDNSHVPMIINAVRREQGGVFVHDLAAFIARDRDKFEQELVAARKKLEHAIVEAHRLREEARDRATFAEQMVGIVSHDLRTPLTTIAMAAEILTRGEATAQQLRVIERITRAAKRSDRLVSDLLDFTQARLGEGLAVAPVRCDPHASIAEVMEELSQAFAGRPLSHVKQGSGQAFVDVDRLAQLVGNLVNNAMAYGDPAGAVTVLSVVKQGALSVSVHNRGRPIAPEVLKHLFQPMVRGETEAGPRRSVGLGLYIVSEIAKAHGGTVQAASDVEAGTTFTASFPAGS